MRMGDVFAWCKSYLECFMQSQIPSTVVPKQHYPSSWKPPEKGLIKINIDAAFPAGENYYATSLVARNWKGDCVWRNVQKFLGRPTVVDGEAYTALRAIMVVREKGWEEVVVEGDNLQVITALMTKEHNTLPFGTFIEDCLSLACLFRNCYFSFIRRLANTLAHSIATRFSYACIEGPSLPSELAEIA